MVHRNWLGRILDLATYAVAGAALAFVVVAVISLALGYGAPGIKFGLFYIGWLLFGYGAIRLFPASLHKNQPLPGGELKTSAGMMFDGSTDEEFTPQAPSREAKQTFASTDETKFQAFVQRLPPARSAQLRKSQRFSIGTKTIAMSLAILGISIVMEFVFLVS